jgi:CubicO group peptidase (beta-lactamase class C family)
MPITASGRLSAKFHFVVPGAILACAAVPAVRAADDTTSSCVKFREAVLVDVRAAGAPSVSAVMVERGKPTCRVLWSAAGAPPTVDQLYGAGSVTKQLTAAGLLAALQERRLGADITAGTIDPRLNPAIRSLTVRQLLAQTSGLRDEPGTAGSADPRELERLALSLNPHDLVAPAGLAFSYSNLGYALAGHLLARLDKQPYAKALRQRVTTPLEMTNATVDPAYRAGDAARPRNAALAPAGFAWISSRDAERLVRAHLAPSSRGLTHILREMRRPAVAIPTGVLPEGRYGMGLFLTGSGPLARLEHAGTLPGYTAEIVVDPKGRGYAVLTDTEGVRFRAARRWLDGELLPFANRPAEQRARALPSDVPVGRYGGNRFTTEIRRDGDRLTLVSNMFGDQPREMRPTSDPLVWQLLNEKSAAFQKVVIHRRGKEIWLQQALWLLRRQEVAAIAIQGCRAEDNIRGGTAGDQARYAPGGSSAGGCIGESMPGSARP